MTYGRGIICIPVSRQCFSLYEGGQVIVCRMDAHKNCNIQPIKEVHPEPMHFPSPNLPVKITLYRDWITGLGSYVF
jgi:hypothetical protein